MRKALKCIIWAIAAVVVYALDSSAGLFSCMAAFPLLGEVATDESPALKEMKKALEDIQNTFVDLKKVQGERLQKLEKGEVIPAALEAKFQKLQDALTAADDKYQKMVDSQKSLEATIQRLNALPEGKQEEKDGQEHKKVFTSFLRKGETLVLDQKSGKTVDGALQELQLKTMSASHDPDGGYVIPQAVASDIVKVMIEGSPIRAEAAIQNISIDEYAYLIDGDDVGSGWVGEHSSRPATATAQMQLGRIVAHEIYANPFATQKMLDDAGFNVEAWLNAKVADRFARTEATAFVTGNGVAKPRGFLTYADGTGVNQVEQIASGDANLITADGLINLQNALEATYGSNAKWFMRRQTVGKVRLLKDTTNNYIWQPGLTAGEPASLLGDPMVKCPDMPAVAANALAVAYGDMRQAYTIVDRMGIRVLRDPYSNKPYVQFYTTKRVGGAVVNGKALKILKIKA